ncbi:tyrosine-type recombinase/integrase [Hymenobacter sp. BT683]|uniref:Tyrosine-type recombinase/integrase n=1 Tax=Hymenobacter jeongseonensis TaxID=2791027 RepID=A0ABS0INJ0_9BACT|nr:tyrosine-type recombinase/integrase [Hymenobacter jeongseonensis]MBF9239891.1 tyrosine-type recombinase/integrase [Hymenobacter jeongseonensis]
MPSDLLAPALPTAQLPAHLVASSTRYVETGLRGAANTVRAYAGDWKRFTSWCALHRLESLPAPVEALAGFLTELADAGKKVATIQRHAAAIAKAHALAGHDSPTADKKVKVLLKGIAREKKTRIKQAAAFTLASFKRTIRSIDVSTPTGLRNRALLLLGFTGAFRRSELEALNIEDLAFDEEGLVVSLDKSKTNQLGQAEEKAIFYSPDPALCPIRSLQAWLRVLDRTEGCVFVSLRKHQHLTTRRMTTKYINLIVQQYLGAPYTAHSLRASFVTVSKLHGADDSKVMNQTKHKTSAMIRRYTRLDNVRQHNAAKELGL